MDSNETPIYHIKVSEVNQLVNRPGKTFVRITGQLEQYDQLNKTAVLSSVEGDQSRRCEIRLDLSMIDNFNINDFNSRFDLMQVFGYLKVFSNNKQKIEFQVVFYRIIKKINLKSFYETIDLQRLYLRKNGYLKENEIFF